MQDYYRYGIIVVVVCVLCQCMPSQAGQVVLARDYPYSTLFLAMAERGVRSYALANGTWPSDLAMAEAQGYFSYLLPGQTILDYSFNGGEAFLSSGGRPVVEGQRITGQPLDVVMKLPDPAPYRIEIGRQVRQVGSELEYVEGETKVYNWDGAQWTDQYNMPAILHALMYKRLASHLAYATEEFVGINYGEPPRDLADLEEFAGAVRNPIVWEQVVLTNSPFEVDYNQGNLFVGWYDGKWWVRCNLGPEIYEYTLTSDSGAWKASPAVVSY